MISLKALVQEVPGNLNWLHMSKQKLALATLGFLMHNKEWGKCSV